MCGLKSLRVGKLSYYIKNIVNLYRPAFLLRKRARTLLESARQRPDWDVIDQRVRYYNQLGEGATLPDKVLHEHHGNYYVFLDSLKHFRYSTFHSAYYFDLMSVARYFDTSRRVGYVPGDVYFTPPFPALVKSRLLHQDHTNSVLLKLDKYRHFQFLKDEKRFEDKRDQAIFRGKIRVSRQRTQFMEMYFGSQVCDCGIVENLAGHPEWTTPRKSIAEHLDYKYIMCLEGNDVATNLKWVMSSNSIAVMPRPTCETWYMEGQLIPDYHYIALKDDLSDLEERMHYYSSHPAEAQQIIQHAHAFVDQFRDEEREQLISLLVMERYLQLTNPLSAEK